ncbi:MAG: arginine N-succinyltransferase, partial [Pseudomonadota bacterium]
DSPFWDNVAGRFFGMTFNEADYFNAINGNQFIADLMPKHPVYVAMLDEDARKVIGVPHLSGRAAMRMLENEGFSYEGYVDIFDGGPTMTARTDQVTSVKASAEARVTAMDIDEGERAILAAGRLAGFRACYGARVLNEDGGIAIDSAAADALDVSEGDTVWSVSR